MRRLMLLLAATLAACRSESPTLGPADRALLTTPPMLQTDTADLAELGTCQTIDSSTNDNGVLACFRVVLSGAGAHNSIQTAIDNLDRCITTGGATHVSVAGYGVKGSVSVGGGNNLAPATTIDVSTTNWIAAVDGLDDGAQGRLTILSCNTGADKRGANLLHKIAKLTSRTVRARTGLTFCHAGVISYEKGSTWQEASHLMDAPPAAIPRPTVPVFETPEKIVLGRSVLTTAAIQRVELRQELAGRPMTMIETRAEVPASLPLSTVKMIDFGHPFRTPGMPAAPVTARLVLEFGPPLEPEVQRRTVIIYGDVLAQDQADPIRFFNIDPALTTLLESMRDIATR